MNRIINAAFTALLALSSVPAWSQEGQLASDVRREGEELKKDCTNFKGAFGCAQTLFTGKPFHIAVGSLAPKNGTAVGPAFTFDKNLGESWRTETTADAVASFNQSWRAGIYFKAFYHPFETIRPVTGPPPKNPPVIGPRAVPEFNAYVQGISLNENDYYGIGPFTSRQSLAKYGLTETIAGGNVIYPVFGHSGLSIFGELNGRFFDPRSRHVMAAPSVEQAYNVSTAPGLLRSLSYFQAGEGVRFNREIAARLTLDYAVTLRQFTAVTDGTYSFQRFTVDASHDFALYRKQRTAARRASDKPTFTFNREGSIGVRALLVESFIPSGHQVPFYLQPTLGGSDMNGESWLPSYPDERFRAPNLLLFRGKLEHVIWGPLGAEFLADFGRVAQTHSDLGFDHFRHSYAVGLTIRGGGMPAVALLFAFGGGEGTHIIANVSPVLLGGSSRPSLF